MMEQDTLNWLQSVTADYHDPDTVIRECTRLLDRYKGQWTLKTDYYANQLQLALSHNTVSPSGVPISLSLLLPPSFPIHPPTVTLRPLKDVPLPTWMRQSVDVHGRLYTRWPVPDGDLVKMVSQLEQWVSSEPISVVGRHSSASALPGIHKLDTNTLRDKLRIRMNRLRQDLESEQAHHQTLILEEMRVVEENKRNLKRILVSVEEQRHRLHLHLATVHSNCDHYRGRLADLTSGADAVWCEEERDQRLLTLYLSDVAITRTIHACQSLFSNRRSAGHNDSLPDLLTCCRRLSRVLYGIRHEYLCLK